MTMRITGLASGLDTESMIQELVKASSSKKEKLEKEQTKMEWKQEAWKTLNTKIKAFYSQQTAKLKFSSAYVKKKTTVGDTKIASIVAGENAVNGTQTLSVQKLAKSAYLTGGKISATEKVTKDSKLSSVLGVGNDQDISIKVNNGKEDVDITLKGSATISDLTNELNKAGLSASFDENNQRFFISAKESGKAGNFTLSAENANGLTALSKLGLLTSADLTDNEAYTNAQAFLALSDEQIKGTTEYNDLLLAKLAALEEADPDGTRTEEEKRAEAETAVLAQMKKTAQDAVNAAAGVSANGAVPIKGEDAQLTLNGAVFTSSTNSFSINGLTITVAGVSEIKGTDESDNPIYEETTINTADDIDGVYDMIKGFFKQYNELITELDKMFEAKSAKGYEPLTDDEKDAMSDEEVEKWEAKIKDALLRRDGNLSTLINTLKTGMLQSFEVDGKKYSLSSFGINTLGYFEAEDNQHGCFHIAGDPDDAAVTDSTDKLKAMLATNSEAVVSFFTQLNNSLYSKLYDLSKHTDNRSYGSFYDDTKMDKDYREHKKLITKAEDELKDMEDRYYDQFSKMETALQKLNSQQTYVSQLFGGN